MFKQMICAGILVAAMSVGLSQVQNITYDVSTIKPHNPNDNGVWWNQSPDGLRFTNVKVKDLIAHAWDIRSDQITGEPSWTDDLRWDLIAKATEQNLQNVSNAQRNEMLKVLLTERLHLKFHVEARSSTIFRLVPVKSGLKLKPLGEQAAAVDAGGLKPGNLSWDDSGSAVVVKAHAVTMDRLLRTIAGELHHTVVDQTGLPPNALFDFELRWIPDRNTALPPDPNTSSMSGALEEQLGLHLESGRGPVPTLVIDSIERPASN